MTLVVFYQPGCSACASMEPLIDKVEARGLTVLRRNVNLSSEIMGFTPKGTPGFALLDRGELVRTATGAMNARELDHFLDLAYEEPRRQRQRKTVTAKKPHEEHERQEPMPKKPVREEEIDAE